MAALADAGSDSVEGSDGFGSVGWGVPEMQAAGAKVVSALGIFGDLFAMLLDAVWSTGDAVVHRRFSWAEFTEQSWFLISVTVLPTILIAIPFGLVLVLEVGGLAVQIGANGHRRCGGCHWHRARGGPGHHGHHPLGGGRLGHLLRPGITDNAR